MIDSKMQEHYDEIKATLIGAHQIMENLAAIERRVGTLGSHARGYTHKITAALQHLDSLVSNPANTQDMLPAGIYYSATANNFYRIDDHAGMGPDFFLKWWKHRSEFPKLSQVTASQMFRAEIQYIADTLKGSDAPLTDEPAEPVELARKWAKTIRAEVEQHREAAQKPALDKATLDVRWEQECEHDHGPYPDDASLAERLRWWIPKSARHGKTALEQDISDAAYELDAAYEQLSSKPVMVKRGVPDYERRIRAARAMREVDPFEGFHNIRNRVGAVYTLLRRLRVERNAARAERDSALRVIARLALKGVTIPKDDA